MGLYDVFDKSDDVISYNYVEIELFTYAERSSLPSVSALGVHLNFAFLIEYLLFYHYVNFAMLGLNNKKQTQNKVKTKINLL